ncbi:cryptochrome/photolyase family protein [uncultured Devosia sp.]|uniref:cryptochrome/photolyase family protein n=1 Tax=uncultured Devosia sp. TaxID=211434 RepID=UPI0035CA550A
MKTLRLILGDQLSRDISSLNDLDRDSDVVLMVEIADETTYAPHHKQKLVLVLSAMRHFAEDMGEAGVTLDYVQLEDAGNSGNFTGELQRAIERHDPGRVVVTEAAEYRVLDMMRDWTTFLSVPVEIRRDDRFICSLDEFAAWAKDRKSFRMEFFYREMRRKTGLLMDDGKPAGGAWNFDADNRKSLPKGQTTPTRLRFEPDQITRDVMALVARRFAGNFGDLEPFGWAVTRLQALEALDHFIAECLPRFGDYQDAMTERSAFLWHSIISPYINIGLLDPIAVCSAAQDAWRAGQAPLNATEGFIRQIIGWREYIRGIYWLKMPDYAKTNVLNAQRPMPWFYWSGETAMNCVANVVADTRRHAYAHHIQRLMVTGNFALLAGIRPADIEEWYLAVYIDAYDWVELPNTHGMAIFADGGLLASKPYAASGAYINRMSDYCRGCRYDPRLRTGPDACPFTQLYWNFLIEHRQRLAANPRMAMPYRNLDRMEAAERDTIRQEAAMFLDTMDEAPGANQQMRLDL